MARHFAALALLVGLLSSASLAYPTPYMRRNDRPDIGVDTDSSLLARELDTPLILHGRGFLSCLGCTKDASTSATVPGRQGRTPAQDDPVAHHREGAAQPHGEIQHAAHDAAGPSGAPAHDKGKGKAPAAHDKGKDYAHADAKDYAHFRGRVQTLHQEIGQHTVKKKELKQQINHLEAQNHPSGSTGHEELQRAKGELQTHRDAIEKKAKEMNNINMAMAFHEAKVKVHGPEQAGSLQGMYNKVKDKGTGALSP